MKRILTSLLAAACITLAAVAGTPSPAFKTWAPTPPMGWNSWDCFGPTVVESEVKANADYMAANLAEYGWEYVVVDIRWFVENDKAGGYNQSNPKYVYDEYGRYTPAVNRFPSAADGKGFKPLADYVHSKGLKFGIHIMRGLPKEAANKKLPVKGADGITLDMIASNDSACTWLRDNYKVDWTKPGAQQYYNSIFDLYAEWGVDFIKVDDLSRPYHTAEVEMIRNAIDRTGRPMILSISPGETPIDKVDHVKSHANMWRTVDDFWDNWNQLSYQFGVCAKWAPHIAQGTWPDADMLPLGKISIRGERGAERWTQFTTEEQYTMMNLWSIFKSPLMFGGDLPQNDEATNKLLTNRDVLYMHHWSAGNGQVKNYNNQITWKAVDPANGDRFAALFNAGGSQYINERDALWRSGTISYLTTGYATDVKVALPAGTRQLALVATDGGDGYDSDHADWINPVVTMADGSTLDLTTLTPLRSECGWGSFHNNSNLNGGKLSIDGKQYDKGLAVHANSILIYDLPEGAKEFSAITGIDNTGSDQGSKSSVEFFVFAYDPTMRHEYTDQWSGGNILVDVDPAKQKACSGFVSHKAARPTVDLSADIKGAKKLYLVTTNGGDDLSYDHADWGNPVLVRENGETVNLTEALAWDANPINGWNAPKLNRNNDGNTITMQGVEYPYGIGCNAPSVITYTLPEGHDYVAFRATVGLDDDVKDAPKGATAEFRVFTEDPAPNNDAEVALDMTLLGLAKGQQAEVTEMWSGEKLGTFKDSEFAPLLKEHGSGLYRVSPLGRKDTASASLEVVKSGEGDDAPFDFVATVTGGGDNADAYVQLLQDGNIVTTLPVDESGKASVTYGGASAIAAGTHTFTVRYSGTTSVSGAESTPVTVNGTGVESVAADYRGIRVVPGQGELLIESETEGILPVYTTDGVQVADVALRRGKNTVEIAAGMYILAGKTVFVK